MSGHQTTSSLLHTLQKGVFLKKLMHGCMKNASKKHEFEHFEKYKQCIWCNRVFPKTSNVASIVRFRRRTATRLLYKDESGEKKFEKSQWFSNVKIHKCRADSTNTNSSYSIHCDNNGGYLKLSLGVSKEFMEKKEKTVICRTWFSEEAESYAMYQALVVPLFFNRKVNYFEEFFSEVFETREKKKVKSHLGDIFVDVKEMDEDIPKKIVDRIFSIQKDMMIFCVGNQETGNVLACSLPENKIEVKIEKTEKELFPMSVSSKKFVHDMTTFTPTTPGTKEGFKKIRKKKKLVMNIKKDQFRKYDLVEFFVLDLIRKLKQHQQKGDKSKFLHVGDVSLYQFSMSIIKIREEKFIDPIGSLFEKDHTFDFLRSGNRLKSYFRFKEMILFDSTSTDKPYNFRDVIDMAKIGRKEDFVIRFSLQKFHSLNYRILGKSFFDFVFFRRCNKSSFHQFKRFDEGVCKDRKKRKTKVFIISNVSRYEHEYSSSERSLQYMEWLVKQTAKLIKTYP